MTDLELTRRLRPLEQSSGQGAQKQYDYRAQLGPYRQEGTFTEGQPLVDAQVVRDPVSGEVIAEWTGEGYRMRIPDAEGNLTWQEVKTVERTDREVRNAVGDVIARVGDDGWEVKDLEGKWSPVDR